MEYTDFLRTFDREITAGEIGRTLVEVHARAKENHNRDVWKRCFGCLDLTSLGSGDTHAHIRRMAEKVVAFPNHFTGIPNVASVCVYPVFVETAGLAAGNSRMAITSVAGGFPSSQTYIEVKMLEAAMAVENGADEIDVVLSIGELLSEEYDLAGGEIALLRNEIGGDALLKVIVESGLLTEVGLIRKASLVAMGAGADFVKTSTGKTTVSATPEAAIVMCQAIRDYYNATGRKVGFKAAGGISTPEDAVHYYTIVEHILGEEWLRPELFRIGASSLANNLLSAIEGREVNYF